MNGTEIRQQIRNSLSGLAQEPLPDAACEFFATLGYRSERRLKFPSLSTCLAEFDREGKAAKLFPETTTTRNNPVLGRSNARTHDGLGSSKCLRTLHLAVAEDDHTPRSYGNRLSRKNCGPSSTSTS